MKVKMTKAVLADALKKVQDTPDAKATLPVLRNALVAAKDGKISFITTDLDQTTRVEVACEVEEPGVTTIPVKLLATMCAKSTEGEVKIAVDAKDKAKITAGTAEFKLAGMPASEFPTLPADEDGTEFTIKQSLLKGMLHRVRFASSKDDTRRTLKGVMLSFKGGQLACVATDGRRLAYIEEVIDGIGDGEQEIILPSKAVDVLMKHLAGEGDCQIKLIKTQLRIDLGSFQIYTKLADDKYPNYRQVIPKQWAHTITIDRQTLLDALDRCAVLSSDSTCVSVKIETGRLIVSSNASDVGEARDEMAVKYDDEETIEARFNPYYLMDPLKVTDVDEITFNMTDGATPVVIKDGTTFLSVLMPLRVS